MFVYIRVIIEISTLELMNDEPNTNGIGMMNPTLVIQNMLLGNLVKSLSTK